MNDKLVSIIVPIYNVEKYIDKCVKSLLAQDYTNIEIILVNDGSHDGSGKIIKELAQNDNRIVVVEQENRGVSSARNTGIELVKGEYVMFVDGDDWVDSDYVSYFMDLVQESGCDIGMDKNNFSATNNVSNQKNYVVDSEQAIEWIYLGDIFVAVWNKIYKTSMLKENKICFNNEIWYGEGMLFNIACLQYIDKVAIGEKSVYHQTFNVDSAMRKFNLQSNFCGIKSLELQKALWLKSNTKIERAWEYHKYSFNRSIIDGLVRSDIVDENSETYKACVNIIRKNILIPMRTERSIKKKIAWCGYFIAPYLMAKRAKVKYINIAKSKVNN